LRNDQSRGYKKLLVYIMSDVTRQISYLTWISWGEFCTFP